MTNLMGPSTQGTNVFASVKTRLAIPQVKNMMSPEEIMDLMLKRHNDLRTHRVIVPSSEIRYSTLVHSDPVACRALAVPQILANRNAISLLTWVRQNSPLSKSFQTSSIYRAVLCHRPLTRLHTPHKPIIPLLRPTSSICKNSPTNTAHLTIFQPYEYINQTFRYPIQSSIMCTEQEVICSRSGTTTVVEKCTSTERRRQKSIPNEAIDCVNSSKNLNQRKSTFATVFRTYPKLFER